MTPTVSFSLEMNHQPAALFVTSIALNFYKNLTPWKSNNYINLFVSFCIS